MPLIRITQENSHGKLTRVFPEIEGLETAMTLIERLEGGDDPHGLHTVTVTLDGGSETGEWVLIPS